MCSRLQKKSFHQFVYAFKPTPKQNFKTYTLHMNEGSGNESEILMLMLDKSTYLKKLA